jgi:hypothetical protein
VKTYLVFEPAGGGRDAATAADMIFLREKFSWPALFFAPLWMLWHRLWLALLVWLLAITVLAAAAYGLDLNPWSTALVLSIPTLIVAFEAAELRRRKLLRGGYRDAGVAIGRDLDEAERRFFADWVTATPAAERPSAPPPRRPSVPSAAPATFAPATSAAPASIVGLFPQPGGGR